MKVAFISGTSIVNSDLFAAWEVKTVETPHGAVRYKSRGDHVLINRHGYGFPLPPHSINYRANIRALADLGFQDIVSLNSVGSLKKDLPPGTLVSCGDYVGLQQGPATYFDTELKGGTPGIAGTTSSPFSSKSSRARIQDSDRKGLRPDAGTPLRDEGGGSDRAGTGGDVIGMTAAHEADLCGEIGLKYNSLAIIDNYANGLEGSSVDFSTSFKDPAKSKSRRRSTGSASAGCSRSSGRSEGGRSGCGRGRGRGGAGGMLLLEVFLEDETRDGCGHEAAAIVGSFAANRDRHRDFGGSRGERSR